MPNVKALSERFIWGLLRPLRLTACLRARPAAFRRALRYALVQLLVTLALASVVVLFRADELAVSPLELAAPQRESSAGPAEPLEPPAEEAPVVPWWRQLWALAVSAVFAAQYVVLAFARDFQDSTSRELALVAGLEPEEDDRRPRIRLDWQWLRRKLRRRIRGVLVVIPGLIAVSPLFIVAQFLEVNFVTSFVTGAWTFYWWTVFSAARTARAWAWENTAPPNAPLRGWLWLTKHVPGFRWWGARLMTRIWVRMTRSMLSPAAAVELDPAAFAGLALSRLIGNLPLLRIFVRPAMSVVAAEIVVTRSPRSALPSRHEARDRGDV